MKKTKKTIKAENVASRAPLDAVPAEEVERSLWQDPFLHLILILIVGFAVYANSVNVSFHFDDYSYLVENPAIRTFDCFPDTQKVFNYAMFQDIKNNLVLRPVTYFTFAVNYAIHGYNLFGYHLVNLLLHCGSAMLVYALFSQLLSTPALAGTKKSAKADAAEYVPYLPLFAALFFICHPLQTQAVTYIIQRFVPLATFFYLAALVLYLRSRAETALGPRALTYVLAMIAAVLAMESKEIAFTLPLIIALVEFMFFTGGVGGRCLLLAPFILTMAIIPAKLIQLPSSVTVEQPDTLSDVIDLVNVGGISSWEYLMTQFGVVTTYLRLLIFPVGQNLDYDYPLQKSFFTPDVLLPLALLLLIVGTGLYLLHRSRENCLNRLIAFGIFWFFITLSVESSIVPIEDVIFEHRAYLPSVGFFMAVLSAGAVAFGGMTGRSLVQSRIATVLLLMMVGGLAAAAFARNSVWQDNVAFWNDVIRKSPNKARPYSILGEVLLRETSFAPDGDARLSEFQVMKEGSSKNLDAAVNVLTKAIALKPNSPNAQFNLGRALLLQKKYDEALRVLAAAAGRWPKFSMPYVIRGEIFEAKKDMIRARQEYLTAKSIEPFSSVPRAKLADIYAREGDIKAAIEELELIMKIFPNEATRKKLELLRSV